MILHENGFQIKVWNRLFYDRKEVAIEIPSTDSNRRRWVGIFPYGGKTHIKNRPDYKFYIVDFELDEKLINTFIENDKVNKVEYFAKNETELISILKTIGVSIENIDVPWKFNYP